MKKTKETCWGDTYIDGKLHNTIEEKRNVYTNALGGRHVRQYWTGSVRKYALDDDNHYRMDVKRLVATTFKELFK